MSLAANPDLHCTMTRTRMKFMFYHPQGAFLITRIVRVACGVIFVVLQCLTVAAQDIRINELMADNSGTLADEDGDFPDWIELYNPSSDPVSLLNWSLTDDPDNQQKWQLPDVTLAASGYLIIFASDKDRKGNVLHTNFKLASAGEFLALVNPQGTVITAFDPAFPSLSTNVSLAFSGGDYAFTANPTPGAANVISSNGIIAPKPHFSHTGGFNEVPFDVSLTSSFTGAEIVYTTDGSEPSGSNGNVYGGALPIATTTVLRAAVRRGTEILSRVATQTYLFLDDVINQTNMPTGYPDTWGPYAAIPGTAIADYEMDPDITQNPAYAGGIKDALRSLPALSIVTGKNNLFNKTADEDSGGIYIYTGAPGDNEAPLPGDGWERPASVELFNADGTKAFEIDCGLRLQGGHSRRAEKSPKHSFRLVFKNEYGPGRLDFPLFGDSATNSFNSIVLRAGFGNTIYHWLHSERIRMQLIRDIWAKDTQLEMGYKSGHGRYVNLFINGLYWGIYNPTEHIDEDFGESYWGGSQEGYDVIKDLGDVVAGNSSAWLTLLQLADMDLTVDANYQILLGNYSDGTRNPQLPALVNPVSLADYMLLNFYGANTDWDHHNWIAIRNRLLPDKGFEFLSWDAEHILENLSGNVVNENNTGRPSFIFRRMLNNQHFKELFADRVQRHCFNGGALTPAAVTRRWLTRSDEIEKAIIAETARWGDYRRDVHQFESAGPFQLYTQADWLTEKSFLLNNYFPERTNVLVQQLRDAGMFPSINAPQFFINNDPIKSHTIKTGDVLTMTSNGGSIFYSWDGTDPMAGNGMLYSGLITLTGSAQIKARTRVGSQWSALVDITFLLETDLSNIKLTEIHYHPLGSESVSDQEFEFIELKNTSPHMLDLTGVFLSGGIQYKFPHGTLIKPGSFIVLASESVQFYKRYGFSPFGQFLGHLNNGGESITLNSISGPLSTVTFDDKAPWPESADGEGYSLVPKDFNPSGDQNDAGGWRASLYINGSPGRDDDIVTGIAETNGARDLMVYQNFPNPFTRYTNITYALSRNSRVELTVLDMLGRKLAVLVNDVQAPGTYSIRFTPEHLNAGVYFYRMKTDSDRPILRRMVYLH